MIVAYCSSHTILNVPGSRRISSKIYGGKYMKAEIVRKKGKSVLADPIFNGLAISLMAGEVASLLLSRTAVPVLYYMVWHRSSRV